MSATKPAPTAAPTPAPAPAPQFKPLVVDFRDLDLPFARAGEMTFKAPTTAHMLAAVVSLVEESKCGATDARAARQRLMDELNADGHIERTKRTELEAAFIRLSEELDRWPDRVRKCAQLVRRVATDGLTQWMLTEEQWRWYTDWANRQVEISPTMGAPLRVDAEVTQTAKEMTITYGPNGKVIGAVSRPIA